MTDFWRESLETRLSQEVSGLLTIVLFGHIPIVFHHITLSQFAKEILIVRDDNELEIRVVFAFIDDAENVRTISVTPKSA